MRRRNFHTMHLRIPSVAHVAAERLHDTEPIPVNCQVTESPRLYVLFRTAVPGILPVTRLPFAGFVPE